MEVIAEIRRRHLVSGESISSIARDLKLSRPTVRKHLQTESESVYLREHQPAPKLGAFRSVLEGRLTLGCGRAFSTALRTDIPRGRKKPRR